MTSRTATDRGDTGASALREQIARHGFILNTTAGSSMRPLIWSGEHCVVVAALAAAPEIGDLLLFDHEGRKVLHRLVEIRRTGPEPLYITRGDNRAATEAIRFGDIIGRVAEVHRLGGFRPWHAVWRSKFSVTDAAYRRYSRLWSVLWPLRSPLYRLRDRLRLILQKIF